MSFQYLKEITAINLFSNFDKYNQSSSEKIFEIETKYDWRTPSLFLTIKSHERGTINFLLKVKEEFLSNFFDFTSTLIMNWECSHV